MRKYTYTFDCWQQGGSQMLVLASERRTGIQAIFLVDLKNSRVQDHTGVSAGAFVTNYPCTFNKLTARARAEIRGRMAQKCEARCGLELDGQLLINWVPR